MTNRNVFIVAGIVGALALVVRLLVVDFGLPFIYTTDEVFEIHRALKLGAGEFDFTRVSKGGYFYLLFVLYGLLFVYLKLVGAVASTGDLLYLYVSQPATFWLPGRVLSAFLGGLACALLVVLGRRAFGSVLVGAGAALLLCFHPDHIQGTRTVHIDAPLVTTVIATFLAILWNHDARPNVPASLGRYLLIAALVAFATMTRIQAALLVIPAILFHVHDVRSVAAPGSAPAIKGYLLDRRLWLAALVGAALYIAGNPGILLYGADVLNWAFASLAPAELGEPSPPEFPQDYDGRPSKLVFYLTALFPARYLGLAFFAASGLAFALAERRFREWCLLSFLVPFFFVLVAFQGEEHIYARYLRPIVPIVWLYAAYGAYRYFMIIRERHARVAILVPILLTAAIAPMLVDASIYLRNTRLPDTRTLAHEWFHRYVPDNASIYIEGTGITASSMTAPLKMSPERVLRLRHIDWEGTAKAGTVPQRDRYELAMLKFLRSIKTFDLVPIYNERLLTEALRERRGEFAILRSNIIDMFRHPKNQEQFPVVYELVQWVLSEEFMLVATFTPDKDIGGPELLVYQRSDTPVSTD